ncbi:MAG TPA: rod shape-determining protein MreC [Chryseosolibacter sp.]|nr:rod shape-determining protein MreC [Chryseosolibacter sp.]
MERLFYFFYQYRAFFTFLILEVVCAWMIIENNQYQGAQFFNSSNSTIAALNNVSQGVREYFLLRNINTTLAEENAMLRGKLSKYRQGSVFQSDSSSLTSPLDSAVISQYDFVSAKVVANTVHRFTNYLTINRGELDSIAPGMAVISPLGIVGKVKSVSKHYSVVTSLLHIDVQVSVLLKRTGYFGTMQWDGRDPDYLKLKYVPTHVLPVIGDTVVTSGYNAVYPSGVMVGVISDVTKNETLFYDLTVKLSHDFRKLSYVEVVRNDLKHELDSLEAPFLEAND